MSRLGQGEPRMPRLTMMTTTITVVALIAVGAAAPSAAAPAVPPTPPASELPRVGSHAAPEFAAAAAALDPGLQAAIERDLEQSPAEYLAGAAAARDAAVVLEALDAAGVGIVDELLEGDVLTIGIDDPADAALVESTGARAVVGQVDAPLAVDRVSFAPAADAYGGDPIYYFTSTGGFRCSLGVNGTSSSGQRQLLTAGHCWSPGITGPYQSGRIAAPSLSPQATQRITVGAPVSNSFRLGGGYDSGLVAMTASGWVAKPQALTWGGGQGAPLATAPVTIRDTTVPVAGAGVCKSGSTTGWTCGTILEGYGDSFYRVGGGTAAYDLEGIATSMCALQGDSGGPALVGSSLVGITSATAFGLYQSPLPAGTTAAQACADTPPEQRISLLFGMRSTRSVDYTVQKAYGSAWEPTVAVDKPVLVSPVDGASLGATTLLTGTLANGGPQHRIEAIVNGVAKSVPVSADGTWSMNLGVSAATPAGVSIRARWGARSVSAAQQFMVSNGRWEAVAVDRLTGSDRFQVAVEISKRAFPAGADVVYVATGMVFPDALSAAPAAVAGNGPILLTTSATMPTSVRAEIVRLSPGRIVIVGGPSSVSSAIQTDLSKIAPTTRISGSDRYVVSRSIARATFGSSGATTAYIATGQNFPDALTSSGAAASASAPVILVDGREPRLDPDTRALLSDLGVTQVKIAGGTSSVSSGIQADLAGMLGSSAVVRFGLPSRFLVGWQVNADAYPTADRAYFATGYVFADALGGAVIASRGAAPMYVALTDCIPKEIVNQLGKQGVSSVTLLGGPSSLSDNVARLKSCG